ncbi:MAG: epoxyqueuosine reductase QueH [bacterium]
MHKNKFGKLENLFLLLCWLVLIARLLTVPSPSVPSLLNFTYSDKLIHLVLFGGLVYFLIEAVESFFLTRYVYVVLIGLLLTIGYAQLMELLQNYIPGRSNSLFDSLAGGAGALIAAIVIYLWDYKHINRPRLLMQVCCMGCGAYVLEELKEKYRLYLFFYNPNIYPATEYKKRLAETRRIAAKMGVPLVVGRGDYQNWLSKIVGHEKSPEKGSRCMICYADRLTATAKKAKKLGFKYFGSTLSISPHKSYQAISQIGQQVARDLQINFHDEDFKKNDGFNKSVYLSKKLNLYRQDYCGCEFSIRKKSLA